jgi:sortase A
MSKHQISVKGPWTRGTKFFLFSTFLVGAAFLADGLWIKGKGMVAQVMLDRAFISPSKSGGKPWGWADISPIARVSAPRLNQSNIVLNNTNGEALAFGPGHMIDTPLPGERGTSVLSAHRDTHFRWIGKLKKGDDVFVERKDGKKLRYVIRRAWVAKANMPGINADSEEFLIALTTCWPLDGTKRSNWRYIVEGVEVPIEKAI